MEKENLLAALERFIAQRPGLEVGNYFSDWRDVDGRRAYNSEVRAIGRDLSDARLLLAAVTRATAIAAADIVDASRRAFSGRLEFMRLGDKIGVEYCTGQYWPTEYRKAVCAVLAAALWAYYREHCNCDTGDEIRATARRNLGVGIQRRWFS